jgi:CRP/FNR family transcriptional regulator, anaerobic regulatory protein
MTRRDIHNCEIPVLCRACEARHGGICGALDGPELLRLGQASRRHERGAGTTLLAPGERVEHCSNILSGVVKVSKLLPDGRQQVVELQFAPDFLGRPFAEESDVLVEAATDVRLCSFSSRTLKTMMAASPALENRMHRQALRQLDDAREWMVTLGQKNAAEKVATFLLLISRHVSPGDGCYSRDFDLPLSRSDIAVFLGLTVETVSRQLTKLRKLDVVRIERARTVAIVDLASLKAAAAL